MRERCLDEREYYIEVKASAYLANMIIRQVDWSLRHHPAAPAAQGHLCLAGLTIADIRHHGTAS